MRLVSVSLLLTLCFSLLLVSPVVVMVKPVLPARTDLSSRSGGTKSPYTTALLSLISIIVSVYVGRIVIGTNLFFSSKSTTARMISWSSRNNEDIERVLEARLRAALWGYFGGDALAAPTHWYYGGRQQIRSDYGPNGITDYTKPKTTLKGSIMNKSNINGGGRGSARGSSGVSVIGDVINHGKRDYWDPNKSYHYHATLEKGENTLEVQLARVLMKSIVANDGIFDVDKFRQDYVNFMTTPGSHNDAYASTCHRMFFANYAINKLPLEKCPDNDGHNVDTIDGLVLPTIAAMAATARAVVGGSSSKSEESLDEIQNVAAQCASATRNSASLEHASRIWSRLVFSALLLPTSCNKNDDDNDNDNDDDDNDSCFSRSLNQCALDFGMNRLPSTTGPKNPMTACYLSDAVPPLIDIVAKYTTTTTRQQQQQGAPSPSLWNALLENANIGGENVHRGSVLGAILGARQVEEEEALLDHSSHTTTTTEQRSSAVIKGIPMKLVQGLHDKDALAREIDDFVQTIMTRHSQANI